MLLFISVLSTLTFIFLPSLVKPSIYRRDPLKKCIWDERSSYRSIFDMNVITNAAYLIAFLYSLVLRQYYLSLIVILTCISSTLYHYNRESMYFNMDCICASSLLVIFVWSMFNSYFMDQLYFQLSILGIPICVFLFCTCGLPAEIKYDSSKDCCIREGRMLYNVIHPIWHIMSSLGPIMSAYYFSTYCPDMVACSGYFDKFEAFPVIPCCAVMFGVLVATVGNAMGFMPMP